MSFEATEGISPQNELRGFGSKIWFVAGKLRSNSKKSKLRVSQLIRRGMHDEKAATDLELRNLKLYIENRSILEANEKLRQTALLLQQENTELTAQIRKKFPDQQ